MCEMFNFINILFIVSFLNIKCLDFNLTNGIPKYYYNTLQIGNNYSFYVQAKQFQNVTFQIYYSLYGSEYVEYIFVNEYSDRNNNKPDKEQNLTVYYYGDYFDTYAMS